MASPHQILTIGSFFGPYRLDRLIGRGGMGEVYQAYDTAKDRVVAIKVLPERLAQDPVYRQRFQRESHAAARLREAHVVPIHDYGEIDGRLYIDMRLVDGENLRELLDRTGPLSPATTVELVRQMAAALDAAHGDGLLHRDVKPDNILITRDGFAYLVDFGIAQSATDESLTTDGSALGSFRYMAPERFSTRDFTPAADVYALTCVMFECLTGTRPFQGGTNVSLMRAHLFDQPPPPSALRPGVPAAFDAVVARGLAKNPNDRFGTAGELAAAAQEATSKSDAPPAHSGRTLGGWIRLVASMVFALVLVAASIGFAGWAAMRPKVAGTAVADAKALTGPDIELLSTVNAVGYKRANCTHNQLDESMLAFFTCEANPATNEPFAQFIRFRGVDQLRAFHTTVFLGQFHGGVCTGDAPGVDAPALVAGKEIGRRACFLDTASSATAPPPGLEFTDESAVAMAIFVWDRTDSTRYRDYYAKQDANVFLSGENVPGDPDSFTDADRALLGYAGNDYRRTNCRHAKPGDNQNAALVCGTPDSATILYGFAYNSGPRSWYETGLATASPHACGSKTGADNVWRRANAAVGRFFCFTDTEEKPPRPCLVAERDDLPLAVLLCTLDPDDPQTGPKTEAELLTWFQRNFG
ncbi:serine/threonine-protein kinase [Nocardia concava]|uniref:serine/threonine-protein kinase n=1 Tax=Nocardia concava TaxID=257281 RepID=UPI0002E3F632|nr:serine/threonine-protein kinase [Nocardia concava]